MTTITTLGMIILLAAFLAGGVIGIGIGSFHTKRKAEAIMKAKGLFSAAEDSFSRMWKDFKKKI